MKSFNKKLTIYSLMIFVLSIFISHTVFAVTEEYTILDSIRITQPATVVEYFVGEPNLDTAGLEVSGLYISNISPRNKQERVVSIASNDIDGFDSSIASTTQTLTITFGSSTTSYDISIVERELLSISIKTPATKTEYTVGDTLDIAGLVICGNYEDQDPCGQTLEITADNISGFDFSVASSTQTLIVTFKGKTISYEISVIDAPVVAPVVQSTSSGRNGGSKKVVSTTSTAPAAPLASSVGEVLGSSTFAFNTDLRLGMQSEDVKQLQERLRAEGFFTFHTSTGYFGPITLAAVKAYQQAHFAEIGYVTGFVGPLTRAVLNK